LAIGNYCVPFHVRNTLSLSICSDRGRTGVICILSSEAVCFQLATSEKPVHDYPFLEITTELVFNQPSMSGCFLILDNGQAACSWPNTKTPVIMVSTHFNQALISTMNMYYTVSC